MAIFATFENLHIFPILGVVFHWPRHERCGKRFSHTRLGVWVLVCGGGRGHMAHEISHFSYCHSPLPDLPLPTLLVFWRFFLEDSFFPISCLLWGVLFVFSLLVTAVFILFSGLVVRLVMNPLFQNICSFIDLVCD